MSNELGIRVLEHVKIVFTGANALKSVPSWITPSRMVECDLQDHINLPYIAVAKKSEYVKLY